jgi:hypothetical protein
LSVDHKAPDRPMPGFFALRLRRKQPYVPAVIFTPCPFVWPDETDWPYRPQDWCEPLDRSPYPLAAKVGETLCWRSIIVFRLWTWGREITAQAYAYLMARRAWCRRWAPHSFEAQAAPIRYLRRAYIERETIMWAAEETRAKREHTHVR